MYAYQQSDISTQFSSIIQKTVRLMEEAYTQKMSHFHLQCQFEPHGGTSGIFTSHAHHMQQNNDYTCSVIATVLQYKGF